MEGLGWRSCQNRLGSVERALGEFSQAETHYKRCLEIDRELGDLESQAIICSRLGLVADEIGNHFKSENWYREAYTISLSTENLKYQSITLCRIGEAQNLRGDYAEAEVTLEKCIEVDQQRKDEGAQRSIAITFEGLGQAKLGLGKYADAREMYQRVWKSPELLNDDVLLSSLHNRLGKLEEAEKNVLKRCITCNFRSCILTPSINLCGIVLLSIHNEPFSDLRKNTMFLSSMRKRRP